MPSQKQILLAVISAVFLGSSVWAADPPSIETALAYKPRQKDVEYETPKPAEFSKCKVELEHKGKLSGWVVLGPAGQVLRKFLDTDGAAGIDQWRYFNHGIEVYRDIDTNDNGKGDQCRWLNLGGSRWGIDQNEDGKIERWKVLSAAEASKEAIRAMIAADDFALQVVMVNAEDLKFLGLNAQLATKLLESAADAGKKAKAIMAKSKTVSAQSRWSRFDAQLPGLIPLDDDKANADLNVYESAMAIVETQSKSNAVLLGEMIRIGEVWKLTQVPLPIDGETTMSNGGILMEPLIANNAAGGNAPVQSPKVENILKGLADLEQRLMQPDQKPAQVKALMNKRASLLKEAIELAETDEEKVLLMKQTVDGYALASQMGTYPEGVNDLKAIEADLAKRSPKSPLLPYTTYRLLQAEYSVNSMDSEKDKDKQGEIQKEWLKGLEEFVAKYPTSDDADDAMIMLGNQEEWQGRTKEATEWYQRLVKEKPKSDVAPRAQGALRRLNLTGQPLLLAGPSLTSGKVDVQSFKDQVVLVVFWASEYKLCEEDLPVLRALYQEYKSKGFEIVGVSLDLDKATVAPFVQKNKMTWPQIYQPSGPNQPGGLSSPLATSFGIISLPTMFLVDRTGKVVSRNSTIGDLKTSLPALLKPSANAQSAKKLDK